MTSSYYYSAQGLVGPFVNPAIYLDAAGLSACGLDAEPVERALARQAERALGVAFAVTRTDLQRGSLPQTLRVDRVRRAYHPQRSGDVFLVQAPTGNLHAEPEGYAAMHGSPYAYDTHVPILLAGPGIPAQRVHRQVAPNDLAVALALYLGVEVPTSSVGEPLVEVLSGE